MNCFFSKQILKLVMKRILSKFKYPFINEQKIKLTLDKKDVLQRELCMKPLKNYEHCEAADVLF